MELGNLFGNRVIKMLCYRLKACMILFVICINNPVRIFTMNTLRLTIITLSLTLLVACGGGGSGGTSATRIEPLPSPLIASANVEEIRTLVGGTPPDSSAPSPSQIGTTVFGIAERSDGLRFKEIATGAIEASRTITCTPGDPMCNAVIVDGMCMGDACRPSYPIHEVDAPFFFVGDEGLEGFNSQYSIVMTDETIPLLQAQAAGRIEGVGRLEFQSYGGWLQNSVFVIERQSAMRGGEMVTRLASYSFGEAAGTNPTGTSSATWGGVMIGVHSNTNHLVQGVAEIEILDLSLSSNFVDVTFSNVKNLHTGTAIDTFGWANLPLTDGGFSTSSQNGSISGNFYGDGHEEVGGIFDRNDIIGAFGAKR